MAAIFWDLENCQIPAKGKLADIWPKIAHIAGGEVVKKFVVASQIPPGLRDAFDAHGFVVDTGFAHGRNVADERLKNRMKEWMDGHAGRISVLISGDKGFVPTVRQLQQLDHRVIVLCHQYNGHQELKSICGDFYDWDKLPPAPSMSEAPRSPAMLRNPPSERREQQQQQSSGSGWGWWVGAAATIVGAAVSYMATRKKDDDDN